MGTNGQADRQDGKITFSRNLWGWRRALFANDSIRRAKLVVPLQDGSKDNMAWARRPLHPNDANRSITLETLVPMADTGAHFLPIQKGLAAIQVNHVPAGMSLISLSDEIRDFDDLTAVFCLTDLLISVDSPPTHLAGALSQHAWVMLPFVPDWRWLLNRDDTSWYSHHRLFRQPCRGDWECVVKNMADALRSMTGR